MMAPAREEGRGRPLQGAASVLCSRSRLEDVIIGVQDQVLSQKHGKVNLDFDDPSHQLFKDATITVADRKSSWLIANDLARKMVSAKGKLTLLGAPVKVLAEDCGKVIFSLQEHSPEALSAINTVFCLNSILPVSTTMLSNQGNRALQAAGGSAHCLPPHVVTALAQLKNTKT